MDRPASRSAGGSPDRLALSAATALAPLGLMALIWFFSSLPDLATNLGLIDLIGRKIVHAASFGLLCLLWWRALRMRLPTAALPLAVAITLAYAAVDEYHQTFVPGRTGSPIDVAIDALGAAVAAALIVRWRRRERRDRGPVPVESGDGGAGAEATASRAR